VGALAKGDVLQVLVLAVLFGVALASLKERGKPLIEWIERVTETLFAMVSIVMKFALGCGSSSICATSSCSCSGPRRARAR
jgi:Na+/H+-dicarboxylate symporter